MTTPTIQTHMKLVIALVVREKHLTDAEYNAELAAIEASARALVAHEREQCALVCERQELEYWNSPEDEQWTPSDCAAAIRARGEITPSR